MNGTWTRRLGLIGLLTPALGAAQEPAGRAAIRADLLGCWTLLDGQSRPAHRTFGSWVPRVVRLDTLPDRSHWIETFPTARHASRLDSLGHDRDATVPTSRWLASLWTSDSLSDTLRVKFGDGRTGVWFSFAAPRGLSLDTLSGTADRRSDVALPVIPLLPAQAVRVRCP